MKLFGLWILTFVDGCILQPQDTCFLFKSRYFIIIYFPFLLYLMLKPRIIRLVTFISEHMMLEKAGLSIIFFYFVFMLMYYQILEYTWRWNFTSFILFNESFISKCFKRDIISLLFRWATWYIGLLCLFFECCLLKFGTIFLNVM